MVITKPSTPTLDKVGKVSGEAHTIGAFLDWLICERHIFFGARILKTGCACHDPHEDCRETDNPCSHASSHYWEDTRSSATTNTLLHEYFGIDENVEEMEKRAVLEHIRELNKGERH